MNPIQRLRLSTTRLEHMLEHMLENDPAMFDGARKLLAHRLSGWQQ